MIDVDHVMQPLIDEAGAADEGSHAKYIAKYTPIGNKRLTLPGVEGSPDPTPNLLGMFYLKIPIMNFCCFRFIGLTH